MKHSRIFSSSKKYFTSQSCPVRPLARVAAELGLTLSVSGGRGGGCWTRGWGRMVRRGSQVLCPEYQEWLQTDSHTLTANTITPKYPIQTKYFLAPRIVNLMLIFLLLNISVNLAENISINLCAVSWHVSARCAVEWILYQILSVMTPSHSSQGKLDLHSSLSIEPAAPASVRNWPNYFSISLNIFQRNQSRSFQYTKFAPNGSVKMLMV